MKGSPGIRLGFQCLVATAFTIPFSIVLGQVFLLLAMVATIMGLLQARQWPSWPSMTWPAALFVGVGLATAAWGPLSHGIGKGSLKLAWFLAMPLTALLLSEPRRLPVLLKSYLLGCGVLGLKVCIIHPVRAWFGKANFQDALINLGSMTAAQMLMMGILSAGVLVMGRQRQNVPLHGWWSLLALVAAGSLLSLKRASSALALGLITLLATYFRRWLWLLAVVLVVLAALSLAPVRARLLDLKQDLKPSGNRMIMWQATPRLIAAYPCGIGYGAMTETILQEYAPSLKERRNHLHSNIAQVLVETGWIGLGVYMVWMGWALTLAARLAWRARRWTGDVPLSVFGLLLMMIALLCNGLVEYNFGDTELMIVYALWMGAVSAGMRWPDSAMSRPGVVS